VIFFIVALSTFGQSKFLLRRGGGLFDKAVEENDGFAAHKENGAGDAVGQSGANFPEAATEGKPSGQPNWTDLMSVPMRRHSSLGRDFSHSRTGSLSAAVR
jgi:hypothetical protein